MPIGTIIGWLIGQLIIGIMMTRGNSAGSSYQIVGSSLLVTALFALLGTGIELLDR